MAALCEGRPPSPLHGRHGVGMLCNPPALSGGAGIRLRVPVVNQPAAQHGKISVVGHTRAHSATMSACVMLAEARLSSASHPFIEHLFIADLLCARAYPAGHKPGSERDLGHAPAEFTVEGSLSSSVEDGNECIKNIPHPFENPNLFS